MVLMVAMYFFAVIGSSNYAGADVTLSKFMDTLKVGFRLASTFLSADQNYLSSIFERFGSIYTTRRKNGPEMVIPFFMKLMGLNTTKVEDFTFDGFVFLTHLIGQTWMGDMNGNLRQHRSPQSFPASVLEFSPFQYIIKQPKVLGLLTQMEDPNLVEFILNESDHKLKDYPEEDVQCIPLLVCKMKPFVRGMQRSLKFFMNKNNSGKAHCYLNGTAINDQCQENLQWETSGFEDRMFFFVPTLNEVISHGDRCDERFPKCVY